MDTSLINAKINSPYSITIRQKEASYNRDVIEHAKRDKELERTFRHNERKLKVTQRGVMSLLGREPYPDCTPENILFSHNLPGFCYRRNGTPRRFNSLAESETRKILDDLEGNMGYLEEPASNILSDNPILSEVLSSPVIVQILCNLRSTAAIMKDVYLFRQFVRNIQKSSPRPLRFKEKTPFDFLRQYRTDLINQFFEALQNEAEHRIATAAPEESAQQMKVPSEVPTGVSSVGDKDEIPIPTESLELHDFTNALQVGLLEVKDEEFQPRYLSGTATPVEDNVTNDPFVKQQLLQLGLKQVESFKGLSPSTYGFRGKPAHGQPSSIITEAETSPPIPVPPQNTSETTPQKKGVSRNPEKVKGGARGRVEFKNFMKDLITEVENVSKAGKTLSVFRGQNASKHESKDSTKLLIKLLRKKSLFSSLNEGDILFHMDPDVKAEVEKTSDLTHDLTLNAPKHFHMAGGFTFHLPPRTDSTIGIKGETGHDHNHSHSDSRQSTAYSSRSYPRESTPTMSEETCESILTGSSDMSRCSGFKSINRVCCGACKAKVWQVCDAIRKRDRRDKDKLKEKWAGSKAEKWANYYSSAVKKKTPGIKGVPTPARRNYIYLNEPDSREVTRRASTLSQGRLNSGSIPGAPTHLLQKVRYLPTMTTNAKGESGTGPNGSQFVSFAGTKSGTPVSGSDELERPRTDPNRTSWTLKVSRLDILKLRHELDVEQIRGELEQFEKNVLRSKLGSDLDQP